MVDNILESARILQNLPFVTPQTYKMQGCQWYGAKQTKSYFREEGEL